MRAFYMIFIVFLLGSCKGPIERCSTDNFAGFDMDNLDSAQYHFLSKKILTGLKPAIIYKFKDHSKVSFATSKDFNLLCFEVRVKNDLKMENVKIDFSESKIQLGKCYSKCGYLGKTLKFRLNNSKNSVKPLLKILSHEMKTKVIKSDYIYIEGTIQNIGLYVEEQEFIFMPYEESIYSKKENLYVKTLLIKDINKWMIYLFYSNNVIHTDVLNYYSPV